MFKKQKSEHVNLEATTGFNLQILDREGNELDSVGTYAVDNQARSREEVILISAARTLAYMFRFCYGNKAERRHFMPHLRDFSRKLNDFITEAE